MAGGPSDESGFPVRSNHTSCETLVSDRGCETRTPLDEAENNAACCCGKNWMSSARRRAPRRDARPIFVELLPEQIPFAEVDEIPGRRVGRVRAGPHEKLFPLRVERADVEPGSLSRDAKARDVVEKSPAVRQKHRPPVGALAPLASNFVTAVGFPPVASTRNSGPSETGANRITPSRLQAPPRATGASTDRLRRARRRCRCA